MYQPCLLLLLIHKSHTLRPRDLQADAVLLIVSKRVSILYGQDHDIEIMKHDIGEKFLPPLSQPSLPLHVDETAMRPLALDSAPESTTTFTFKAV